MDEKLVESWDGLRAVVRRLRDGGLRVALTNGCYDLLHVGHLRSLRGAREQADRLIVAINSDASAERWKGRRPIVPEAERAEMLAGLECIDHVFVFEDASVDRLLEEIRPDVYCKGPEYTMENLPEADTLRRLGADLVTVGDPKDHSSTDLIARVRAHDAGEPAKAEP